MVAAIYPVAPESQVEAGLASVEAVFDALVAEVGAENISVVGDSAGGGLALAFCQQLSRHGKPLPASQVLFFPWLDVTVSDPSQPALQPLDHVISIPALRKAGESWAGNLGPASPLASPLFGDLSNLPPTLSIVGTHDILLPDTRRLGALQPEVTVVEYPGLFHGWVYAPLPETKQAIQECAAFIEQKWSVSR